MTPKPRRWLFPFEHRAMAPPTYLHLTCTYLNPAHEADLAACPALMIFSLPPKSPAAVTVLSVRPSCARPHVPTHPVFYSALRLPCFMFPLSCPHSCARLEGRLAAAFSFLCNCAPLTEENRARDNSMVESCCMQRQWPRQAGRIALLLNSRTCPASRLTAGRPPAPACGAARAAAASSGPCGGGRPAAGRGRLRGRQGGILRGWPGSRACAAPPATATCSTGCVGVCQA